jgi:hypothetical protein
MSFQLFGILAKNKNKNYKKSDNSEKLDFLLGFGEIRSIV